MDQKPTLTVACAHCSHAYTHDEMHEGDVDLWVLAINEETAALQCPVCDMHFFVKGSYIPQYTSAFAQELL